MFKRNIFLPSMFFKVRKFAVRKALLASALFTFVFTFVFAFTNFPANATEYTLEDTLGDTSKNTLKYDIFGYKFPVESAQYLDGDLVNITIKGKESAIVEKDKSDFYVFENLVKANALDEFYKICGSECLSNIFQSSFNQKDFNLSSLSYILLVNLVNKDEKFINLQDIFLESKDNLDVLEFYKYLFSQELPTKLLQNENVNKKLSEYCIKLSLNDSANISASVLGFVAKNEKSVALEFDRLLKESVLFDNSLNEANDLINLEEKLLGFSSSFYQKHIADLNKTKRIVGSIKKAKSKAELEDILLSNYKQVSFFDFIEEQFLERVYFLVDESLKGKLYSDALNTLMLVPQNKVSEKTLMYIQNIFEHSPKNIKLLTTSNFNKLKSILKNNDWLKEKVIIFEEAYLSSLIKNFNKNDFVNGFNMLLELRPNASIKNDSLKISLAFEALSLNNKGLSNQILSTVNNKFSYLISFRGLFLFCKRYLWMFFAVATAFVFIYISMLKASKGDVKRPSANEKVSEKSNGEKKVDLTNEIKEYQRILKYFDLSENVYDIKKIKSAYRKKIKQIHPDIIGKETKEFSTVQEMYKSLLKLHSKILSKR
ncbi:MAG: hypothetical protein ACOX3T_03735 [Bdellovibrionota bacterium]